MAFTVSLLHIVYVRAYVHMAEISLTELQSYHDNMCWGWWIPQKQCSNVPVSARARRRATVTVTPVRTPRAFPQETNTSRVASLQRRRRCRVTQDASFDADAT